MVVAASATAMALGGAPVLAAPSTPAPSTTESNPVALNGFAAEFAEPPNDVLPTARYWVASGTGDPAFVADDVRAMARNGIGSATYNDLVLAQVYDPRKSFGTPAWSDKLRTALRTANEEDLRLDLLISPGWSAGSDRVKPDDPGASKVLRHGRSNVLSAGATFSGQLPLSTLAAGATKRRLQGVIGVRCDATCDGTPTRLIRSSVVDLTDAVTGTSSDESGLGLALNWTAPAEPADGKWLVLAFWSQGNALKPTASIDGVMRNVYQVDHYSRAGTEALIDPWEEQVLDADLRSLLRANGGSMWLDSVELHDTNWTDSFMSAYRDRTGRSYVAGLPTVRTNGAGPFVYDDDSTEQYRSEWTRQLTDMHIRNHLDVLKRWSHSLGMKLRYQSYFTIGPAESVIADEAWSTLDVLDAEAADSRAVAAVGAMAGKNINSTECCAFLDFGNDSWRQRWTDMLYRINESFSTGANGVEYHGYSQTHGGDELNFGIIPGATNAWPGWNPFVPITGIGDSWDRRQPAWEDQGGINTYVGRNQLVLRQGDLRSDFAVYTRSSKGDSNGSITDPAVAAHGYSWGYMSDQFVDAASLEGGVLFPNGPRYRGLVLDRTQRMPVNTARKIAQLARRGLPLVILGDAPSLPVEAPDNPEAASQVQAAFASLEGLPNVTRVPGETADVQEDLPAALAGLDITPLTRPSTTVPVQTITRRADGTSFVFVLNTDRKEAVETDLTIAGRGRPYALDAWTGSVTPVPVYSSGGDGVTVPLRLAPGATAMYAITTDEAALGVQRLAPALSAADGEVVVEAGKPVLRAMTSGSYTATTQDGETLTANVTSVPAPIAPKDWELQVESWEKPVTGVDSAKRQLPPVALRTADDGTLPSWRSISAPVDLREISGLGTYRTSVDLGADWTADHGAYLDLGPNFQTYSVSVNGRAVTGENQTDTSRLDLGGYLQPGLNNLTVRVSTTLRNAIINQAPTQAGGSGTARQEYGLRGPIVLHPYVDAALTEPSATPPVAPTPVTTPTTPAATAGDKLLAKIATTVATPVEVGVKRKFRVTLRAGGVVPSGTVKIRVKGAGRRKVYTKTLTARGRTKVWLPRFDRTGRVVIRVVYQGDARVEAKKKTIAFKVVQGRTIR